MIYVQSNLYIQIIIWVAIERFCGKYPDFAVGNELPKPPKEDEPKYFLYFIFFYLIFFMKKKYKKKIM